MLEKRQTGQFLVKTEDGETISVFEYTDIILTDSFGDPEQKEGEGIKEYRTADNKVLNRLGDVTYEIVESGQKVKRIKYRRGESA